MKMEVFEHLKVRAYMIICKGEFKRKLSYKWSFWLSTISKVLNVLMYCFLWQGIFRNSSSSVIKGFTKDSMICYVITSFLVSSLISGSVTKQIADDVREGNIAMSLCKPISYRVNLILMSFGDFLYKFVTWGIVTLVIVVFYEQGCGIGRGMEYFTVFTLFVISSFILRALFDFCFGMIAVKTTYSFGLMLIKDAFLAFISGQMIPYDFMPDILREIFNMLPFGGMVYTPSMLLLGRFSTGQIIKLVIMQFLWIILMYILSGFFWKKTVKQVTVLGG